MNRITRLTISIFILFVAVDAYLTNNRLFNVVSKNFKPSEGVAVYFKPISNNDAEFDYFLSNLELVYTVETHANVASTKYINNIIYFYDGDKYILIQLLSSIFKSNLKKVIIITNVGDDVSIISNVFNQHELYNFVVVLAEEDVDIKFYGYIPYGYNRVYRLINESFLFDDKFPPDLSNFTVVVKTEPWAPYVLQPLMANVYTDGIEIDLIHMLSDIMGFQIDYKTTDYSYESWDEDLKDKNSLFYGLLDKRHDVVICSSILTEWRNRYLDYSEWYFTEMDTLCAPKAKTLDGWKKFKTIIYIHLIIVVPVIVYSYATRLIASNLPESTKFANYVNLLFLYQGAMLNISSNELPTTLSARILISFWLMFVILLNATYNAVLYLVLSHPTYETQINTKERIIAHNLDVLIPSHFERYFTNSEVDSKLLSVNKGCDSITRCLQTVAFNRTAAAGAQYNMIQYDEYRYRDATGTFQLYCFNQPLAFNYIRFLVRKNYLLKDRMNLIIKSMKEAGILQQFMNIAFYKRTIRKFYGKLDKLTVNTRQEKLLTINDFKMVFYIYLFLNLVASVVFLVEYINKPPLM